MHKEPLSTTPVYFNAETFGMPLGMVEGKGLVAWGTKEWLKLELSAPTPTSGEGSSQSLVASDLISLACAMRPPLKKRKPNLPLEVRGASRLVYTGGAGPGTPGREPLPIPCPAHVFLWLFPSCILLKKKNW